MNFDFTIKNYRCFDISNPLHFQLTGGFHSLIGRNNAGKSALLRFFFEYRNVWRAFRNPHDLCQLLFGRRSIALNGINDPASIFCDNNRQDIHIEIGFPLAQSKGIEVKIQQFRDTAEFLFSIYRDGEKVVAVNDPPGYKHKSHELVFPGIPPIPFEEIEQHFLALEEMQYFGSFRNVINQGSENYYDLAIGTSFINQWSQWKTGDNRRENKIIRKVESDIARLLGFKNIDISTSPDRKQLHITADDKPYKIHEMGGGLGHLIVSIGNAAVRNPSFLLIDEPELGLHPTLQSEFLATLASYARNGTIFSTHSVGLARSMADKVFTVQRQSSRTTVRAFEAHSNLVEFLGELGYTNTEDITSTKILLVEGVEDVKTIQQFLRRMRKSSDVVLIPLGGESMINKNREQELLELTRLSKNVYALIDSERDSENATVSNARLAFVDICKKLNITAHILQRRALENYFSQSAIQAALQQSFAALSPYQRLKDAASWSKHENWRIAREMDASELEKTDLGKFLSTI
jgi:ABC-type cobalamin/Fe3+-siderophores transport system ATPase subunit